MTRKPKGSRRFWISLEECTFVCKRATLYFAGCMSVGLAGAMVSRPFNPNVDEMRDWLCGSAIAATAFSLTSFASKFLFNTQDVQGIGMGYAPPPQKKDDKSWHNPDWGKK